MDLQNELREARIDAAVELSAQRLYERDHSYPGSSDWSELIIPSREGFRSQVRSFVMELEDAGMLKLPQDVIEQPIPQNDAVLSTDRQVLEAQVERMDGSSIVLLNNRALILFVFPTVDFDLQIRAYFKGDKLTLALQRCVYPGEELKYGDRWKEIDLLYGLTLLGTIISMTEKLPRTAESVSAATPIEDGVQSDRDQIREAAEAKGATFRYNTWMNREVVKLPETDEVSQLRIYVYYDDNGMIPTGPDAPRNYSTSSPSFLATITNELPNMETASAIMALIAQRPDLAPTDNEETSE